MNISIIFKNDDFLVIHKPSGLPSAPLHSVEEDSALSQAIKMYPVIKNIKGRKDIEYGLLHRLDTVTSGLLLIALNQIFFDYMINLQQNNCFIKTYKAICNVDNCVKEGFPAFPYKIQLKKDFTFTAESYFRAYGKGKKEVRPVIEQNNSYSNKKANFSKKYLTEIKIIEIKNETCVVECKISNGFRHQVRNHLAWANLPIIGDELYNKNNCSCEIQFWAVGLDFNYKGKDYSFRKDNF